jgi:hypothetical protein
MSTREKILGHFHKTYPQVGAHNIPDWYAEGAEYILNLLDEALHDRPYIEVADFLNEFDED